MKSIAFPKMFNNTSTNIIKDREATESNLKLLLMTALKEQFGDPGIGTDAGKFLFEQNTSMMDDMARDAIYTAIATFIPQIRITREDIVITHSYRTVECSITAINQLDFKVDTYNLILFQTDTSIA